MRTWVNRKLNDIVLRRPALVVNVGQGNTRPLHTVVAVEKGEKTGAPIHTALAVFTDAREAAGYKAKAEAFAGKVRQPKGARQ